MDGRPRTPSSTRPGHPRGALLTAPSGHRSPVHGPPLGRTTQLTGCSPNSDPLAVSVALAGGYVAGSWLDAGTVVDISIRSTQRATRDHVVVTVPNSVLNSARIVNRSGPRPHTRVGIPVGVAYGSDVDEVQELPLDVAENESLVVENPHPRVRFRGFGDSALDFERLVYVANPMADARTTHRLNRAIYERFGEAGVEIPFPQRVVTMQNAEPEPTTNADAATGPVADAKVESGD